MKKILFAGTLASCFSPLTNADVINFDNLATGTIVDDEYSTVVSISVNNKRAGAPDLGVVFDTTNYTGGDSDLAGPFDSNNDALADGFEAFNVLIIQENSAGCDIVIGICDEPDDEGSRPAGTFFFTFEKLVTLESIDFFDVETTENGETENNAIKLFDAANNEILPGEFYTPDTGGDNMWDQVFFGVDGVKRIELNMGGSGAIDNIRFTVVPIPAAAWLFGSGLIGLAGLARRKT